MSTMTQQAPSIPSAARIAFIGGGNMARSLIAGLVAQGLEGPRIWVAEPQAALREALKAEFDVQAVVEGTQASMEADLLVLAVKPQVMSTVCRSLAGHLKPGVLVLSIAAGVPCRQLADWLDTAAVVRAMPNTPALLGAGATGLFAPAAVDVQQRALAAAVMNSVGLTVWIEDEAQMDVVTALSGSGPAYFFLLVEALIAAAMAEGLPREAAEPLARQTALGAARMLVESNEAATELRRRVTSPGGTTEAAIQAFESGDLRALTARAIQAAVERGRQLAGG
jgi:pyrroline-5-carboxylate reductase